MRKTSSKLIQATLATAAAVASSSVQATNGAATIPICNETCVKLSLANLIQSGNLVYNVSTDRYMLDDNLLSLEVIIDEIKSNTDLDVKIIHLADGKLGTQVF